MASGETLLKITDFPFSYSLTILIVGIWGIEMSSQNVFILIASAGALGTFFTIADPLGRSYRFRLEREVENQLKSNENDRETIALLENSIKAIQSRSIKLETDKLVSMGYFVIILFVFGTLLVQGDLAEKVILTRTLSNNTSMEQMNSEDESVVCDSDCIRIIGFPVSYFAMFVIILIGKKRLE